VSDLVAVDPSPAMQRQLRRRNRAACSTGRLRTVTGDLGQVDGVRDADLVVAIHVVYFWKQPVAELRRAAGVLRPRSLIALAYQLRDQMPAVAQRDFPRSGDRVFESDDEVHTMLVDAGFAPLPVRLLGDVASPAGRLMLASRP